jgi:hypothetical protein
MRHLIRNKKTGRFFVNGGNCQWVSEAKNATDFPSTQAAKDAAREHGLDCVELYYQFPSIAGQKDVSIPLD